MSEKAREMTASAEQVMQMKKELLYQISYCLPEAEEMIRQAARMGCLERNAEYEVALEEKEYVVKRIQELMYVISNCKIV